MARQSNWLLWQVAGFREHQPGCRQGKILRVGRVCSGQRHHSVRMARDNRGRVVPGSTRGRWWTCWTPAAGCSGSASSRRACRARRCWTRASASWRAWRCCHHPPADSMSLVYGSRLPDHTSAAERHMGRQVSAVPKHACRACWDLQLDAEVEPQAGSRRLRQQSPSRACRTGRRWR